MAIFDNFADVELMQREEAELLFELEKFNLDRAMNPQLRAGYNEIIGNIERKLRRCQSELYAARLLRDAADPQVVSVVTGVRRDEL